MKNEKEINLEDECGMVITASWELDKETDRAYHFDFKIHKAALVTGIGYERIEFHDEAASNGWESTPDKSKALPWMEGSLKWDGCINYKYPGQEHCMLHNCGFGEFERQQKVMKSLYAFGKELMGGECE